MESNIQRMNLTTLVSLNRIFSDLVGECQKVQVDFSYLPVSDVIQCERMYLPSLCVKMPT